MAENKLTLDQEDHLQSLLYTFRRHVTRKYTAGAAEHGGNIWDHSATQLVNHAIDECVDQFVYLVTLRRKLMEPVYVTEDIETRIKKEGERLIQKVDKRLLGR